MTSEFLAVLGSWHQTGPGDFNGDGIINILDLLSLLGNWGPCPGCPAPWTEDFSDGIGSWVNQVPGAWQVIDGVLTYVEVPGSGHRHLRNSEVMMTTEAFEMVTWIDTSSLTPAASQAGLIFGANQDMSDVWAFAIQGGFPPQWHLVRSVPGLTYDLGHGFAGLDTQPHELLVRFDGTTLDCFVDGELATSRSFDPPPLAGWIPDGFVGFDIWDSGTAGTVTVDRISFGCPR